jgi:hypothetical protein
MVIYFQHIVSLLRRMAFWCPFLKLHLTTYHSISVGLMTTEGLSMKARFVSLEMAYVIYRTNKKLEHWKKMISQKDLRIFELNSVTYFAFQSLILCLCLIGRCI